MARGPGSILRRNPCCFVDRARGRPRGGLGISRGEVGVICTTIEIRGPHGSHVRMRSTASSPHSTLGLLKLVEQVALANFGRDDV